MWDCAIAAINCKMAAGWWHVAKRVFHWGPLVALGLIVQVGVSATYSLFQLSVLPKVTVFKGIHNVVCYIWVYLVLKNFFQVRKLIPST